MCICSQDCGKETIVCQVCDAARATSAAPTYFPVAKIDAEGCQPYLSDGGFENNNPTLSIIQHYSAYKRAEFAAPYADEPQNARHGDLDFTSVRYVNIGTGTITDALARHRDSVASLLPGFIRMGIFLKETLTEIAVSAEKDADSLRIMAEISSDKMKYERFSADTGVCFIKLYHYKKLPEIKRLTNNYLEKAVVQEEMMRVANELAEDYLDSLKSERSPASSLGEGLINPAKEESTIVIAQTPHLKKEGTDSTRPGTLKPSPRSSEHETDEITKTPSTAGSLHESDSPAVDPPTSWIKNVNTAITDLADKDLLATYPPILPSWSASNTIENHAMKVS